MVKFLEMKGVKDIGSFIARQPNGLLCRFSSVVDCPTHWNMTEDDYRHGHTGTVDTPKQGQDIIENYMKPFSEVLDYYTPNNMPVNEFIQFLEDSGYITINKI